MREALFDILGSRVRDATFLDAYAGTGAVGLEALSRGARRAVFLERNRAALRLIDANLARAACKERSTILAGEVGPWLERLARRGESFQVIFLDPPYDTPVTRRLLEAAAGVLDREGILALEHAASRPPDLSEVRGLRPGRSYRYGDTALTVLWPADEGSGG